MTGILRAVAATDPGLQRWSVALRATVTWIVVVATLLTGSATLGGSASYVLPGMLVVSAATMSLTMDITRRQRLVALLLGAASASAALTLGTLVAGKPLLESIVFLALGAVTLGAFLLGPAAVVVALAAVVAYYAASLVTATWQTLPGNIASAIAGAVLSAILLGVALADRPTRTARRLVKSVDAASARIATASLRNRAQRVNDVLTAVMAARAHAALYPEAWPEELRSHDSARLSEVATAAETGIVPSPISPVLWPAPGKVDSRHAPDPQDPGGRSLISMGIQLLVAATLALVAAQLIYPQYWFWGVLAALVMLFGTTSASDAIGKGLRRVLGTAAALPLGIVLAQLVQHNLVAMAALIVVVMFLQQYLGDIAYGWSVFFLTLLLSLLFSVTGTQTATALEARLLLTAIGAGIGIVVALVVLPTRTGKLLRGRALGAIDAATETVTAIAGGATPDDVDAHQAAVERRLRLLRDEAVAAHKGWPFSARHNRTRYQVLTGEVAARNLRRLAQTYRAKGTVSPAARTEAERLLRLLDRVRHGLSRSRRSLPTDGERLRSAGDDELAIQFERTRAALRSLAVQLNGGKDHGC